MIYYETKEDKPPSSAELASMTAVSCNKVVLYPRQWIPARLLQSLM